MNQQVALFLLTLLAKAKILGRDAANLYAAQQWLQGIADGKLVVKAKEAEAPLPSASKKGKTHGRSSKSSAPSKLNGNRVPRSEKLRSQ